MRSPFMKYAVAGALAVSLAAGGAVVAQAALTKTPAEVTAGNYDLDSGHGKITWSVNHFGLSTYTGQFVNVKAELKLDSTNPSASTLTATIPLTDVAPNDDRLKAHLQTADFFDTANHPTATFVSRSVTVDADDANEATVVGDLTLRGVTKPVTLAIADFRCGTHLVYRRAMCSAEATATIRRSEFGMTSGLPNVAGDDVRIVIPVEATIE